jgi:hypothetical protein
MSYIDTISNKRVGTLAGYPVYQPLGTLENKTRGAVDFGCTPANLVLGGGSGEHPALVVHHFDQLVSLYLLQAIDWHVQGGNPKTPYIIGLEDFLEAHLELKFDEHFEFCGWGLEQTAEFLRSITDPSLPSPYRREVYSSAEHWLAYSLAEYCLEHAPDLMGPEFATALATHSVAGKVLARNALAPNVILDTADY